MAEEFEYMTKFGFTPMGAIQSATFAGSGNAGYEGRNRGDVQALSADLVAVKR